MSPAGTAKRPVHAEAMVSVVSSERDVWDATPGASLAEVRITEIFTGDLQGESQVRALEIASLEGRAKLASVQRFQGRLHGRQGAFVLEGHETVEAGRIHATWRVTPGSGTEALQGLRGDGGFEGEFGKGSRATLDYWFDEVPA